MFESNIRYSNQAKGAIGELYLTAKLLLMGHDVANSNFTVKNTAYYDLLCRKNGEGKAYPLQVKTTFSSPSCSFRVGMRHGDFMDDNGKFNKEKGRKIVEDKVQCSWAFVLCEGSNNEPQFSIYILTRQQVIDLVVESEEWYLTERDEMQHPIKPTGDIGLLPIWLKGDSEKPTKLHNYQQFNNPLTGHDFLNKWNNIWKD